MRKAQTLLTSLDFESFSHAHSSRAPQHGGPSTMRRQCSGVAPTVLVASLVVSVGLAVAFLSTSRPTHPYDKAVALLQRYPVIDGYVSN